MYRIVLLILLALLHYSKCTDPVAFSSDSQDLNKATNYRFTLNIATDVPSQSTFVITFPSSFRISSGALTTCNLINPSQAGGSTTLTGCSCTSSSCTITIPSTITSYSSYQIYVGSFTTPAFVPNPQTNPIVVTINFPSGSSTNYNVNYIFNGGSMDNTNPVMTQGSFRVYASTTYSFTFVPVNNIPAGGYVFFYFPLSISLLSGTTITATVNSVAITNPSVILNYEFEYLSIGGLFSSAFVAGNGKSIAVTVNNIQNPSSEGNSDFIKIVTTNELQNLIDSSNYTLYVVTNIPGNINSVIATTNPVSSTVVNTITILFFKLDLEFGFPTNGALVITLPSQFTFDTSISCAFLIGNTGTNTPTCIRSGYTITSVGLRYTAGSPIWIQINGVRNPSSTQPTSTFDFKTIDSNNRIICTGTSSYTYQATPGLPVVKSVVRTVAGIGTSTVVTVDFTIANAITQNSIVQIAFPLDQITISDTFTCASFNPNQATLACTKTTSGGYTTVKAVQWCSNSGSCPSGTELILQINTGAVNPNSIALPLASSLVITTLTSDGLYIFDQVSTGVVITPSLLPSTITNIVISRTGSGIVGLDTSLKYSFDPSTYIKNNGGNVLIYFPSASFYSSTTQTISCTLNSNAKTCSITSSATTPPYILYITIQSICSPVAECTASPLVFDIINIRNKINTSPIPTNDNTNPFIVETQTLQNQRVDYTIWTVLPDLSLTPNIFTSFSSSISNSIVGAVTTFTLSFTPSTEIPTAAQNSKILISVPSEVLLDPQNGATCSANIMVSGNPQALTCTYSTSSNPQTITLTHSLATFSQTRGNPITLTLTNLLRLPSSTKPSSVFTVRSITTLNSVDYYIDQSATYIISATTPATLVTFQATRTNAQVNSNTDISVSFTPLHPIPNNGIITMVLPSDQLLPVSGDPALISIVYNSASIIPTIISSSGSQVTLSFIIPCSTVCVAGTSITFAVKNLKNPPTSAPPSNSIQLTSSTADAFSIDTITTSFFAQPSITLGTLSATAIAYSSNAVGDTNAVTFSATTQNPVPSTGTFLIQLPDNQFFVAPSVTITCQSNSQNLPCTATTSTSDYGSFIQKISITLANICPSSCAAGTSLQITVNSLTNFFTVQPPGYAIRLVTLDQGNGIDNGNIAAAQIPTLVASSISVISSVTRSNINLNTVATFVFYFRVTTLIPKQGTISIGISSSNQAYIDSNISPTCSLLDPATNALTTSYTCSPQADGSILILNACSSAVCPAASVFKISISGIKNADFYKSSLTTQDSFSIITKSSDGYVANQVIIGLVATPSLATGSLTIASSSRSNLQVSLDTVWSIQVQFQSALVLRNQLVITLPPSVFYLSSTTTLQCTSLGNTLTITSTVNSQRRILVVDSYIRTLVINNICSGSLSNCVANAQLSLSIRGLRNPSNVQPLTDNVIISTQAFDTNSNPYTTDTISVTALSLLQLSIAETLLFSSINSNYQYPQTLCNMTFEFKSTTPISAGSTLIVTIPTTMGMLDFAENEGLCTTRYVMAATLTCSKAGTQLTVKGGFTSDLSPTRFAFTINYVYNPSSQSVITGFVASLYASTGTLIANTLNIGSYSLYSFINPSSCSSSCLSCGLSTSSCLACPIPSNTPYLDSNSCDNICPDGTIAQYSYCVDCYDNCATCFGPQSDQCLTCNVGYELDSGTCVSSCSTNTVANAYQICQSSQACSSNCVTCSDESDYCLSCNNGFVIDPISRLCINQDTDKCSDRYYLIASQCQLCTLSQCATCINAATQCTQCPPYYGKPFLDMTARPYLCVASCPTTSYSNSLSQCISCNTNCQTCSGPGSSDCLTCYTSGSLPKFQYGSCVAQCQSGYTEVSGICYMNCADSNCYQCSSQGSSTCLQCRSEYALVGTQCVSPTNCANGTFFQVLNAQATCSTCSSSCMTCSVRANNCTSCYNTFNSPSVVNPQRQYLFRSVCVQQCPVNYSPDYTDNLVCKNFVCTEPCEKCGSNASYCVTCSSKYPYSYENYCYDKCPTGTKAFTDPKEGFVCIATPKFWTVLSEILIALALLALILFIASLFFMPKPRRDVQSFIILLFPVEWLSMTFLIPNLFVVRTLPLLTLSVGTFSALIILGVLFNQSYLGFFEDNLKSVQRHKSSNPKTFKLGKITTFVFGIYMIRVHSSGIFKTSRAEFAEFPQYRINADRYVLMGIVATIIQIATDIWGLIGINFRREAYSILILNLLFNGLLIIALLLDLLCSKSTIKASNPNQNYNKVQGPEASLSVIDGSRNNISQLDASRDDSHLTKRNLLKSDQNGLNKSDPSKGSVLNVDLEKNDGNKKNKVNSSSHEDLKPAPTDRVISSKSKGNSVADSSGTGPNNKKKK